MLPRLQSSGRVEKINVLRENLRAVATDVVEVSVSF